MAKEARDQHVILCRGILATHPRQRVCLAAALLALGCVAASAAATEREAQWSGLAAAVSAWQPPVADIRRVDQTVSEGELTLTLQRGDADRLRVILTEVPRQKVQLRGETLNSLMWLTDPHSPAPAWQDTLQHLRKYVGTLDQGQFRREIKPPPVPPPPALVPLTWALLLLSIAALCFAMFQAMRELEAPRFWLPLILAAWLLSALVPHRMVMVYFGFLHIDQAVTLRQLPRYGPATTLLDHALFALAPVHHATVQHLHAVLGALTLLPLAALAQGLAGRWAARVLGIGLMLLPVALLDHGLESMLVPAMLWWSAGTLLLSAAVDKQRVTSAVAAVVLLALAGLARPDCLVMALPTCLCVLLAPGRPLRVRTILSLTVVALAVAALWLPDMAFLRDRANEDLAAGNLPRLNLAFIRQLPELLIHNWLVLDYRYWPLTLTLLAFAGLFLRETWRPVAFLWLASALWAAPMLLDFNETSELRLHMPSGLLVILAAATTLGALRQRLRPHWIAGILVATLTSFALTAPRTFAPQLSDRSETAIATAAHLAHDGRRTALIVRSYDDDDKTGIHLFWPQYLLEPGDRWLSVRDWQAGALQPGERALGVVDVRCHAGVAVEPNHDARIPESVQPHPSCQALWRGAKGSPLWQQVEPNVGERGFAWYPPPAQLPTLTQAVLAL